MDILQQTYLTLGPLLTTFLLGITTVVLLFWHSSRKQSYWKNIGIPYVEAVPFFGSKQDRGKPFQDVELERFQKYGRIYGHYEGNQALLSVGEPQILRDILVKDFQIFTGRRRVEAGIKILDSMLSLLQGEDWKRVRSIVSPTFTTGKIRRMISIFKDCSKTLVKNFKESSIRSEPINAKSIYGAFIMDAIASSAFSTKINSHNDPNNQFAAAAKSFFSKEVNWKVFITAFFPRITKFFRISIFSYETFKFFHDVTLEIIKERKRSGQTRNDFLQLLLDTAKEVDQDAKTDLDEKDSIVENYGKKENDEDFKSHNSMKTLSIDELVAQCAMFFIAGYDTTATTLSFVSYSLALNPDIQEKVIQEVDEILRTNDGDLTYEAVQSMKYLDNVISETLRLYPPLIRTDRVAEKDYKLADTGLIVPKGMIVTIPMYAMHRDPELFPNPEKFDPDRFTAEERAKRDPYSYLPFGAGPRNCVGMRFALIQMKVCLAYVLSNFRIKKCSETKVPLDFYNGVGLLQPKAVSLFMEEREDAAVKL